MKYTEHPATDVLRGKTILFLGSSVTYGAAAGGESFVEYLARKHGVNAIKAAVSGTTLAVTGRGDSYVERLKQIDRSTAIDCAVVQLSTNDAAKLLPLGEIERGRALSDFNTQTVTGAMEYIIRYCKDVWRCPAVFYTGAYFESAPYAAMVRQLYALQGKWDMGVIDLYTDAAFNAIGSDTYGRYMADPIHPTKEGYVKWWGPEIENRLAQYMNAYRYLKTESI